jgi:hypothetical protein
MSTHEVGISDFFGAKNRQMANFIFKMAKIGVFFGFLSRQISTKKLEKSNKILQMLY